MAALLARLARAPFADDLRMIVATAAAVALPLLLPLLLLP